ncbi:MAG: hypothetical protein ACI83P_002543 [Janthinobacterium sp.]
MGRRPIQPANSGKVVQLKSKCGSKKSNQTEASTSFFGGFFMPVTSLVSPELIAAYRATHFCSTVAPGVTLTLLVDKHDLQLGQLQGLYQVSSCAVITAYNPYSEPTADATNVAAQKSLILAIDAMGLHWFPASGVDPDGIWPAEPSLLVLGINIAQADALAHRFGQNAYVFCDESAIPSLQLCR